MKGIQSRDDGNSPRETIRVPFYVLHARSWKFFPFSNIFANMSQFNDLHRLLMQSMLSKKMVTEHDAMNIYAKVCDVTSSKCQGAFSLQHAVLIALHAGPADVEFPSFVSALNKELDKLDYSLRLSRNEQDGIMYVVLVNTNQDSATELATQFTAVEMAFIRELVHNRHLAHAQSTVINTAA